MHIAWVGGELHELTTPYDAEVRGYASAYALPLRYLHAAIAFGKFRCLGFACTHKRQRDPQVL